MNKTAIKNFAIWARNKLIADISYRAGLMGITAAGIHGALPQSTGQTEFYDIGTAEPYAITGEAIRQRRHLIELIQRKEKDTDYKTAYKYIIEEVAYTWFNRLIAVRFMEVNDYLPSHIRVLSSDTGKLEPDIVTTPFDAELEFTNAERQTIIDLKNANKLDEVFRLLFIKQCNALNEILPALFEKTNDYTELLLNLSVIDQDGVVYHLVHDILEEDFDVENGGQVEIIGWLYQYYNAELNDQVYDGNMSKDRVTKELLPAATTIYTPDWAIRYMSENSIGRIWIEGHPNAALKSKWKYYLEEAEQESDVKAKIAELRKKYATLNPEDIKVIDPCMGSGHILVYAFDLLMQIYESAGYGQRDAARSILENNLYGLDIDDRAFQIAYFAVMMKARQYNRRILNGDYVPNLYSIKESNNINKNQLQFFGKGMNEEEKKRAITQVSYLMDAFEDAKEYGSILHINQCDWCLLHAFVSSVEDVIQLNFETVGIDETQERIKNIIIQGECLSRKYSVVITNPPYLGSSRFSEKLNKYIKQCYGDVKSDLSMVMYKKAIDDLADKDAFVSFITASSWMTLSSFEKLRRYQDSVGCITTLVDFGTELFEGKVGHNPIVAWTFRKRHMSYRLTAIRLVDFCYSRRDEKEPQFFNMENRFYSKGEDFSHIQGSPIAYWFGENLLKTFSFPQIKNFGSAKQGLITGDNARFLRLWFEVSVKNIGFEIENREEATRSGYRWFPYNKGGDYRKWYGNNNYVVDWYEDGNEIRNFKDDKGKLRSRPQNLDSYYMEGITWSDITSGLFSARYTSKGYLHDSSGPKFFCKHEQIPYFLALLNSKPAYEQLKILAPTFHFREGPVSSVTTPPLDRSRDCVKDRCLRAIKISKEDWDSREFSWGFKKHPLIPSELGANILIKDLFDSWSNVCSYRFTCMKKLEEEINQIFISAYNLEGELIPDVNDKDITIYKADMASDIRSLLSYAIGCLFGRYSLGSEGLTYAGGDWNDSAYTVFKPDVDNVIPITDEEYLEDDIVSFICEWLKDVYGEQTLEENLDYISRAISRKGESSREIIRNYFLNDFFKDHCQVYSVTSSGKRPIYWLFDSGKQNGFKALIYLHRYNADTIGNLRIDYLHRMQRVYESEISRMQDMIDHSTNAREVGQATKRRDKLTKQLKECREYDEKLAHLALSRIELDLDDGVKVNYRKLQTANDGKFYEVLADSKNIMAKK